jgi:hypothetical protein
MFFGPLRYHREEWAGDDVVRCDFLSRNVYSQKARKLLSAQEKKIISDGIVLLQ